MAAVHSHRLRKFWDTHKSYSQDISDYQKSPAVKTKSERRPWSDAEKEAILGSTLHQREFLEKTSASSAKMLNQYFRAGIGRILFIIPFSQEKKSSTA